MLKKLQALEKALQDNKEAFEILEDISCSDINCNTTTCGTYQCTILQLDAKINALIKQEGGEGGTRN